MNLNNQQTGNSLRFFINKLGLRLEFMIPFHRNLFNFPRFPLHTFAIQYQTGRKIITWLRVTVATSNFSDSTGMQRLLVCYQALSCLPTIPLRSRRPYSSQMTDIIIPDPNRSDLFYHVVNPPTPLSKTLPAFAISFLHHSPPRLDSSTVLGWLPAETYMTGSPDADYQNKETSASLRDFVGNREYYLQLAVRHSRD